MWESAYKKALNSVFDTPVHDSVYEKSYNLALESCTPGIDQTELNEILDTFYKPL